MRVTYVCIRCGSRKVARDAWAEWDEDVQEWVLGSSHDYAYCHRCASETRLVEVSFKETLN